MTYVRIVFVQIHGINEVLVLLEGSGELLLDKTLVPLAQLVIDVLPEPVANVVPLHLQFTVIVVEVVELE